MKKRAKIMPGHGATSFVHCPSCFATVAAPFLSWHLAQCPSSNRNTQNANSAHSLPSGLAPPTPVKKELAEELPRLGANGNRGFHSSSAPGSSISSQPYGLSPALLASHKDSLSPAQEDFPQNFSQEDVGLAEHTNVPCIDTQESFDPKSSDSLASCLKSQEEHFRRRERHLKSAMSILRRKYEEVLRREQELQNNYRDLLTKEQDLQRQLFLSKQAEEKALKLVESLRGELQEERGLGGSDRKQIEVIDLEDGCRHSDWGATGLGTANSAIVRLEDGHEDAVSNRAFGCSLKSHDSPSLHKNVACPQIEPSPVLASLVQGGPKEVFSPALKVDGNFRDVVNNVDAIGTCIVKNNKVIRETEMEQSMQGLNTSSSPYIKNTCAFCRVSVLGSTRNAETVGEGCPCRHADDNSKWCNDLSKSVSCPCTPYRLGADQQTTSNDPSDIDKVLVKSEILENQSLEPGPQTPGKLGRQITLSNPSDVDKVLEKSGKLDDWCPESGFHTPQMSSHINKVLEKSQKLYDRSPEHSSHTPEKSITFSEIKEHQNMVSRLLFPGDQSRQSLCLTEADVRARDQSIQCHLVREESEDALGSRAFAAVESEAVPIPNSADMSEHKLVSDQYQTVSLANVMVAACNPGTEPASLAESRQERDPKTQCPERGAGLSTEEQFFLSLPQTCSGNQLLGSRSLSSNNEETHLLTRKAKSRRHRSVVLSDSESESSCRRNLESSLQGAKSWQIGSCQTRGSDLNVLKNQSEMQNILKYSERGGFATNIGTTGLSDTNIEVPSGGQSEQYSHDTKIMEKAHNQRRKKLVKGYRNFQNEKISKKDQVNELKNVLSAVKDGQNKHSSAEAGTKQPETLMEDATIEGSEEGIERVGVSVRRSERLKKSSSRKAENCIQNESVSNGNGSDKNEDESLGGLLAQASAEAGTKQPETLMEDATIEGFEEVIERAGVSVGVRRSERLRKSSSRKAKNSIQNESVSKGNGSDKSEGESLGGFLVQEEESSDCKSMSCSDAKKLAKDSICSDGENAQPSYTERTRSSRTRKRLFDELSETENNDNSKPGCKIQTDNRLGDRQDSDEIINLLKESDEDGDGDEEDEVSEGESLGGFIVNSEDSEGREDSQTSKEGDLSGSSGGQESSDGPQESFSQDSSSSSGSSFRGFRRRVEQKRKSYAWEFEADLLAVLATDSELCLRAVCALYRQQTEEEQRGRGSFSTNKRGFDKIHASKGSLLAEFLTDEVPSGPLKKSVEDLEKYDSNGVEYCRKLAFHHSKQLFEIYKNGEDPHFPFR